MKKKAITIVLSAIVALSIVGCSNSKDKDTKAVKENTATAVEDSEVLQGTWSQDYTRDEVMDLYEEALARVESTAKGYSLEYEVKENEITEENGVSINNSYVYLDIDNAERLESMYYGFKQYGSDLASGKLEMKIGYKLDKEAIKGYGKFEIENISLGAFSQAFTGDYERDYSELNAKLFNILTGTEEVQTIENNLDGIKETITIMDDYLLYKLETRVYNFK